MPTVSFQPNLNILVCKISNLRLDKIKNAFFHIECKKFAKYIVKADSFFQL